ARRALDVRLVRLAAGTTVVILSSVLADWPDYNLVTPIIVAVGAGLVAYSWRLVSRLPPQPDALPSPAGSPALRRMGLVLLCVLVAATLFWSTATIAQWSGRGLARQDARHLDDLARMIRPDRHQPVRTMSGAPNRAASAVASSRWF